MINKFIGRFTEHPLVGVVKVGKRYYQMTSKLQEVMNSIDKSLNREAQYAGLFLGEEKGKEFKPSLPLLDLLGPATHKWVKVDDKAEWLFICGRDVFGKSVVTANVKKGIVLVVSQKQEVLGYGVIIGSLDKPEKVFLNNILDKGDFLRREMRKKKKN